MTALTLPRLLGRDGKPLRLDPDLDAPLTGPPVVALVDRKGSSEACTMWRTWQPFHMLRTHGYHALWGWLDDPLTATACGVVPVIILPRVGWPPGHERAGREWFRIQRKHKKIVLYEVDDDLFSPFMVDQQSRGIARHQTREKIEGDSRADLWAMQQCDGVTVTTQYLASTVRRFTDKPVEVVPNAIDVEWFQAVQRQGKRTIPGLTIGWAGGHRPDTDLTEMAIAWGRIAKRYPHVTFVVQGSQPWVLYEQVPPDRMVAVPWMPVGEYPKGLLDIDIGCCPLENRPFNRCKTPIKAWEYALSGAAVVASPTVYYQSINAENNGMIATSAVEWEESLAILIEDREQREYLAGRLKQDVIDKWSLKRNYWRWPAAWNRLCGGA